jgi:hypothetical protein
MAASASAARKTCWRSWAAACELAAWLGAAAGARRSRPAPEGRGPVEPLSECWLTRRSRPGQIVVAAARRRGACATSATGPLSEAQRGGVGGVRGRASRAGRAVAQSGSARALGVAGGAGSARLGPLAARPGAVAVGFGRGTAAGLRADVSPSSRVTDFAARAWYRERRHEWAANGRAQSNSTIRS